MEPSWQHSCPGCTKPGSSFPAQHKIRCDTSQDRKVEDQGHPHVYTEFRASLGYNESLLKQKQKLVVEQRQMSSQLQISLRGWVANGDSLLSLRGRVVNRDSLLSQLMVC